MLFKIKLTITLWFELDHPGQEHEEKLETHNEKPGARPG